MGEPTQAEIIAALSAQTSFRRAPPPTATWAELELDAASGVQGHGTAGAGPSTNPTRIYCFREACGSLILLPNVASSLSTPSPPFPAEEKSPYPSPPASAPTPLWHVPGAPMAFENIGFSRSSAAVLPDDAPGGAEGKRKGVKWLICAECDAGPVGWSYEGGREAWIAADRVRYGKA